MHKIRKEISAVVFGLMVSISGYAASEEGFQGLGWGSKVEQIKRKFPHAEQDQPDTEKYPACKKSDGSIYYCTISESMCISMGKRCSPPLTIDKYMVGTYQFKLSFELSKNRTLNGVSLEHDDEINGKSEQYGLGVYEHISSSLEKKYGPPAEIEQYQKDRINEYVGARKVWRVNGTQINLNYLAALNASTKVLERVNFSIIYSPLLDDYSSNL